MQRRYISRQQSRDPRYQKYKRSNLLNTINIDRNPWVTVKPRTISDMIKFDSNKIQYYQTNLMQMGMALFRDFNTILNNGNGPYYSKFLLGYGIYEINLPNDFYFALILEMDGQYIRRIYSCSFQNSAIGDRTITFGGNQNNYLIFVFKHPEITMPFQFVNDAYPTNSNNYLMFSKVFSNDPVVTLDQNPIQYMKLLDEFPYRFFMYKGNISLT